MSKSASAFFKEKLRQLRREKELTQEQAAELCGIPYKLYQFYELGIRDNPGLKTIEKICRGFDVSLPEFFSPLKAQANQKPTSSTRKRKRLTLIEKDEAL